MSAIPWTFAAIVWLPVAFAGALGFVPLVGILALFAFFQSKKFEYKTYMLPLFLGLGYTALSSVWSPYSTPLVDIDFGEGDFHIRSAVLRVFLVVIFGGVALAAASKLSKRNSKIAVFVFSVAVIFQALSLMTINYFPDQVYERFASFTSDRSSAILNLSRNIVCFSVGAIIVMAVIRYLTEGHSIAFKLLSGVWAVFAAYYCHSLSGSAAAIGILAAWFFMFFPAIFGKYTFRVIGCLTAAFIVLSPICFSILIEILGEKKYTLEPSFWWRIEIWSSVLEHATKAPIIGNGLDALRTFDETFQEGAFQGEKIIPLHAHNMLLHLWVETGYIGIFAAALGVLLFSFGLPDPYELGPKSAAATCGLWALCLTICTLSFSVWSEWWWALLVVAIGFIILLRNTWVGDVE